ncbi:MAG: trigger factor [Patescibacteria group bacterium]
MDSTIEKQEDGTIVLNITIPSKTVKDAAGIVLEEVVKSANVAGFRKGKAPKKIVEEKIDKDKIKEEVLKKLLPQAYADAVKKHDIKPIINPRIHVEILEDDKDWKFTASTCEAPQVDLNGYKENIKKITSGTKIIIPGKEQKETSFEEIITELQKSVSVKISKIIVEQEVERLLAQTLSEIKRLGLTLDQYLTSTHRTVEELKEEYEKKAINDIKLEFALQKIAEEEKIAVTDADIDEAIKNAKDENERKGLEANKYLLASIIRQQKTLDFLKKL